MNTMAATEQPRRAAGSPDSAGGQWVPRSAPAPSGELPMSFDPNEQRFLWPTKEDLASAESVIELTFNAPVSTRVLSNAQAAYQVWRDEEARLTADERLHEWIRSDVAAALLAKVESGEINRSGWDERSLNEHVRFKIEAESRLGRGSISAPMLPAVVRAGRAYALAGLLADADRERVDAATIQTQGGTFSVSQLVQHYNTHRWLEAAMTDSDYAVIRSQERLMLADDPYERLFRQAEARARQEAVLATRRAAAEQAAAQPAIL